MTSPRLPRFSWQSLNEEKLIESVESPKSTTRVHFEDMSNMSDISYVRELPELRDQKFSRQHAKQISTDSTLLGSPYGREFEMGRSTAKQPTIFHLWWAELGAILLSLCALFAILGIVYQYRELRAAPKWFGDVNINTLIAILGVVLRVGLVVALAEALSQQKWLWFGKTRTLHDMAVFDQATRGTWGSLKLLFRLSSWGGIAAFGALLIILSVAIDPFTQQLVHFNTCHLPSGSDFASVPRRALVLYSDRNSDTVNTGIPLAMQSSIYAPQANNIPMDCRSGQCIFKEPYYTLAYSSTCDDISDKLNVSVKNIAEGPYSYTLRNMSLTTGTFLVNETGASTDANVYLVAAPLALTNASTSTFNASNADEYITSTFDVISIAKKVDGCNVDQQRDPKLSWQCRGYGAARCSVKPSVQKLIANVTNGTVTETILSSASNWGVDLFNYTDTFQMLQVSCLTEDQKSFVRLQGYKIDQDTEWLPYNSSVTTPYNAALSNTTFPQCFYSLDSTVTADIRIGIGSLISGNTMLNKLEMERISWTLGTVQRKMYNNSYVSFDYIENFFTNVSKGVSIGLRQATPGVQGGDLMSVINRGSSPALGTLLEIETCVEIRWAWLAYPAVMIALTALFVLLTIMDSSLRPLAGQEGTHLLDGDSPAKQTRGSLLRPAGSWKSSLLPYMFHGLDDWTLRSRDRSRLLFTEEMDREVRQMRVKLAPTNQGWKLVPDHDDAVDHA